MLLDDTALEFYESCSDLIKNDVNLLKEAILAHFDPKELKIVGWSDLHTRKQRAGETLAKYYEDMKQKANEIDLGIDSTLLAFISGLPLGTKKYVSLQNPESIDDAYSLALKFQQVQRLGELSPLAEIYKQAKKTVNNSPSPNIALASTSTVRDNDLHDLHQQVANLAEQINAFQSPVSDSFLDMNDRLDNTTDRDFHDSQRPTDYSFSSRNNYNRRNNYYLNNDINGGYRPDSFDSYNHSNRSFQRNYPTYPRNNFDRCTYPQNSGHYAPGSHFQVDNFANSGARFNYSEQFSQQNNAPPSNSFASAQNVAAVETVPRETFPEPPSQVVSESVYVGILDLPQTPSPAIIETYTQEDSVKRLRSEVDNLKIQYDRIATINRELRAKNEEEIRRNYVIKTELEREKQINSILLKNCQKTDDARTPTTATTKTEIFSLRNLPPTNAITTPEIIKGQEFQKFESLNHIRDIKPKCRRPKRMKICWHESQEKGSCLWKEKCWFVHDFPQISQELIDQVSPLHASHGTPNKFRPQSQQPKKRLPDCWSELGGKGTCVWKDRCRYNHNISQKRDEYQPDGKLSDERLHSPREFLLFDI